MKLVGFCKSAFFVFALLAGSVAQAAILQIDFSSPTSGSPNPATGSIVLDIDLDSDVSLTSAGVVSSDLNFNLDGNVGYQYFSFGQLTIGDDIDTGASLGENDFFINILGLKTATPSVLQFSLVQADQGFIAFDASQVSLSVSEVPLPAAVWLFGSAVLGLGIVKRKTA